MIKQEEKKIGAVTIHLLHFDHKLKVEEYYDYLLPREKERLQSIRHSNRRREYLSTRILRTLVFGKKEIHYSSIGAPSIVSTGFISISHTKNIVGIAQCPSFQVGLDIEPIREKVLRVKEKFLGKHEKENLNIDSVEEMTRVWSGKEAMYKLANRKGILFSTQLLLKKKEQEKWEGTFQFNEKSNTVDLILLKKDNYIISINSNKVQ